jgi:hypothetical protein
VDNGWVDALGSAVLAVFVFVETIGYAVARYRQATS